jgi:hypothetical protein
MATVTEKLNFFISLHLNSHLNCYRWGMATICSSTFLNDGKRKQEVIRLWEKNTWVRLYLNLILNNKKQQIYKYLGHDNSEREKRKMYRLSVRMHALGGIMIVRNRNKAYGLKLNNSQRKFGGYDTEEDKSILYVVKLDFSVEL